MIVLDTNLIFAKFALGDENHKKANEIFNDILTGKFGLPILLDYVYNEILTLIYIRTKNFDLCMRVEKFLKNYFNKDVISFVQTPSELFWKANQTFLKQEIINQKRFLSFTDSIIGEMAIWLNSSYIGTFDGQFYRFGIEVIPK